MAQRVLFLRKRVDKEKRHLRVVHKSGEGKNIFACFLTISHFSIVTISPPEANCSAPLNCVIFKVESHFGVGEAVKTRGKEAVERFPTPKKVQNIYI